MRNNLYEQIKTLDRIKDLIKRKATGTPEQLSQRIQCSRASVFRYIDTLKKLGCSINYCKDRQTYFFDDNENFDLNF